MKRFGTIALGVTLVGVISALPSDLVAYTGEKLAKGAKVSIEQARAIALQARAGAITYEKLERDKAAAVFATPSTSRAMVPYMKSAWMHRAGTVLENKKEGPHPD